MNAKLQKDAKLWRKREGLTQLDVAKKIGISVTAYAIWERGERPKGMLWENMQALEALINGSPGPAADDRDDLAAEACVIFQNDLESVLRVLKAKVIDPREKIGTFSEAVVRWHRQLTTIANRIGPHQ